MIPLRLISSSIRTFTALTSNQLTPAIGVGHQQTFTPVALPTQWSQRRNKRSLATPSDPALYYRTKSFKSEDISHLPPRPTKPLCSWVLFLRERRGSIVRELGRISASKITKMLADEWRQVDKSRYEREYKQMLDDYKRQVDSWWSSLNEEQRQQYNLHKSAKDHNKNLKTLRATNPPKMPRSAFNLYIQARSASADITELKKTTKLNDILKKLNDEYRALSDYEKQKYLDMQQQDKLRFGHEFLAWYESVQNDDELNRGVYELAEKLFNRMKRLKHI